MYKYFKVIGYYNGELEVLFSSYDKEDCVYELEAERDSWKDEGYKQFKIVFELVNDAPDKGVYPHLK